MKLALLIVLIKMVPPSGTASFCPTARFRTPTMPSRPSVSLPDVRGTQPPHPTNLCNPSGSQRRWVRRCGDRVRWSLGGWVVWEVGVGGAQLCAVTPPPRPDSPRCPPRGGGGVGGVGGPPPPGGVESPLNNVFFGQFGLKRWHVPLPPPRPGGPPPPPPPPPLGPPLLAPPPTPSGAPKPPFRGGCGQFGTATNTASL